MSEWYYSGSDNERKGPVSAERLKGMIANRELSPEDLIWEKGMKEWMQAGKVEEFVSDFQLDEPPELPARQVAQDSQSQSASEIVKFFDWQGWDLGRKMIFISACVSVFTMLLKWVDVGFASANGFSQGAFLFLGVFVYPLLRLFRNESINKTWGIACGGGGILLSFIYIGSKSVEIFGRSANLAASGPYLFLLACIGLIVGVVKSENPTNNSTPDSQ